jgi:predicted NAD/FAD-dependent oxidoreductase
LRFIHTDFDRFGSFDVDGHLLTEREELPIYDHWLALLAEARRVGGEATVADVLADLRRAPRWSSPPGLEPGLVDRYLDWIAATEIAADLAADLDELSIRALDDGVTFDGPWVMLDRGYRALLEPLAEGIDIRLGEWVSAIDDPGGRVRVTSTRGIFEADRVVVTVPLGVLKAGSIAFTPDLPPPVRAAIDRLGMGRFLKAVMRFPERVWPGGMDWLGRIAEPAFAEFVNLSAVTGEPILVGFATGAHAERLEGLDDDAVVAEALGAFRAVVGPDAPAPSDAIVTRWGVDPFAHGAYSFMAVGATSADRDALGAPVSARLILAGEAASSRYPSTVHGAWMSGETAADRLLSMTA